MARAADLSGRVFGKLTARHPTERRDNGSVVWLCECECGGTAEVSARNLVHSHTTTCGCAKGRPISRGEPFGALRAVERVGTNARGQAVWLCECECGKSCEAPAPELRYGTITSCGCGAEKKRRIAESAGIVEGTKLSMLTTRPPANNKTGVKGVFQRGSRFVAQIKFQGEHRYLGTFGTLEEAAEARRQAEEELFGPVLERHGRKLGE